MRKSEKAMRWVYNLSGPVLSLIVFLATYFIEPLKFSQDQALAAMPAFFLSIIVLLIGQVLSTNKEVEKTKQYSGQTYEAVKKYLHVIQIGSPETAMEYLSSRLPSLREVKNTSFTIDDELERAEEKFYDTPTYADAMRAISKYSSETVIWKDIGDKYAIRRFRDIQLSLLDNSRKSGGRYKYRVINHNEPQINFSILEYKDSTVEVLFNWDFRGGGQDPIVLMSRDQQVVQMFALQFNQLWKRASVDHDSSADKSEPMKYDFESLDRK